MCLFTALQARVIGHGACPEANQQRAAAATQRRQGPACAAHIAVTVSGRSRLHTPARSFSPPWPAAEAAVSCALHQRLCQAASSPLAVSSEAPGGALSGAHHLPATFCSSLNTGRASGVLCAMYTQCTAQNLEQAQG